ncbi:hypothetical protein DFP72DRAFT_1046679 [Ephemerocybe angulata]|uniref:Uncharacterized protein n=1 Tax=Ephemerocybe angulata TaxID=980116 RepID=A0A8H6HU03_9AGAR|nr:hypothetical protein DFP72DRAFT_1046679 [Tulosesus angulatus]
MGASRRKARLITSGRSAAKADLELQWPMCRFLVFNLHPLHLPRGLYRSAMQVAYFSTIDRKSETQKSLGNQNGQNGQQDSVMRRTENIGGIRRNTVPPFSLGSPIERHQAKMRFRYHEIFQTEVLLEKRGTGRRQVPLPTRLDTITCVPVLPGNRNRLRRLAVAKLFAAACDPLETW